MKYQPSQHMKMLSLCDEKNQLAISNRLFAFQLSFFIIVFTIICTYSRGLGRLNNSETVESINIICIYLSHIWNTFPYKETYFLLLLIEFLGVKLANEVI